MFITKVLNQHRRDTVIQLECEVCKHEQKQNGYDDDFFYREAVPKIKCEKCGESQLTSGKTTPPRTPNVPAYMVL